MKRRLGTFVAAALLANLAAAPAWGEERPTDDGDAIFDASRPPEDEPGSAQRLTTEELGRYSDDSIERGLALVPGVVVLSDDGYGLRPSIGIRGARPAGFSNVALLEDGVLAGPAPYSAPTEHYLPMLSRLRGIEVLKGSRSILYGPSVVGGVLNLRTRGLPRPQLGHRLDHRLGAELVYGNDFHGKGLGHYGFGAEHWAVLVEAARVRNDGFTEIDGGGDKGFDRTELMAKARVNSDPDDALYHEALIKLGITHERSELDGLGLTDFDFEAAPLRRYRGSSHDGEDYLRGLIELTHVFRARGLLDLRTTLYRHDMAHDRERVEGVAGGPALAAVLADPVGQHARPYQLLAGSDTGPGEALLVGRHDSEFISQGIQTAAKLRLPSLGPVEQRLTVGLRLHYDEFERLDSAARFGMRAGALVPPSTASLVADSRGSATALSAYLLDEIRLYDVTVAPAVRIEQVTTAFEQRASGTSADSRQRLLMPSIGAFYRPIEPIAVLFGVHQAVSPVAAGQLEQVEAEARVGYEAGSRIASKYVDAEVIGFLHDYSNVAFECSFRSGCSDELLGRQIDGGPANVYGFEASATARIHTPIAMTVPVTASYTFTKGELAESFTAAHPELGAVEAGDPLPYIPTHHFASSVGLASDDIGALYIRTIILDEMWESSGSGGPREGAVTSSFVVFDAAATVRVLPELEVYGRVDNLLNNHYVAARRPFGARPGRPRLAEIGVRVDIDR